jgi:lysophospholipid acyltransferase
MERNRYYFVWLMAEGSSILSGFGYNGLDEKGNHKW